VKTTLKLTIVTWKPSTPSPMATRENRRANIGVRKVALVSPNAHEVSISVTIFYSLFISVVYLLGNGPDRLQSSFMPDTEPPAAGLQVSSANAIIFHRTICTISPETGGYSFTENNESETGLLNEDTLFLSVTDRGKTKDVYGVSSCTVYHPIPCLRMQHRSS
jgi:hypothetical protein